LWVFGGGKEGEIKMKVLYVDMSWRGGIADHTELLVNSLCDFCDVSVLLPNNSVIKDRLRTPYYTDSLENALKNDDFDIIHFSSYDTKKLIPFTITNKIKRKYKIVYSVHNVLPHIYERKSYHYLSKFMLYHLPIDAFVAFSNYSKDLLTNRFIVDKNKIYVIPFGNFLSFNKNKFTKETAREKLKIPVEKKVVLFFGYVRKYKGLDYLVEAFKYLDTDSLLLVIAGPPYQKGMDKYLKELSKISYIKVFSYHINRDEIEPYFKSSDIVVYPYVEIFTTSALQLAFAFKKPVIATNIGCFPEDISDAGLLVPPKDPKALAQAIEKLIDDEKLQRKLAKKGYERAKTYFSWEKIAFEYIKMYEDLIDK